MILEPGYIVNMGHGDFEVVQVMITEEDENKIVFEVLAERRVWQYCGTDEDGNDHFTRDREDKCTQSDRR